MSRRLPDGSFHIVGSGTGSTTGYSTGNGTFSTSNGSGYVTSTGSIHTPSQMYDPRTGRRS